ncbi:MAG: prepilin-type N-terminal cleavage/methylation protein [Proteobacteria bacterium]|nr:prepilin-type N-terminal cleavage/methylation protein [Pseudomonadota bacterium]
MTPPPSLHYLRQGFTLIELVVVLAIVALLLALATPRYFHRVDKSKETILKANLAATRDVLDKYYGDNDKYPEQLETLVEKKYLRSLPYDPITESTTTWLIVPPDSPDKGGVFDIHSGAEGNSSDGSPYSTW